MLVSYVGKVNYIFTNIKEKKYKSTRPDASSVAIPLVLESKTDPTLLFSLAYL